jgi:hypothetical protein
MSLPSKLGHYSPGCGLYNFAAIINLLPSAISPVLTNIVADGNGNYELMDNAATNIPG